MASTSHDIPDREPYLEPPSSPRPLVAPAVGLMLGIAASNSLGFSGAATGAAFVTAAAAALIWMWIRKRDRRAAWRLANPAVFLIAGCVGIIRCQTVIQLPKDHVAHLAQADRVLECLQGVVITPPYRVDQIQRNPFQPNRAGPQFRFLMDTTALRNGDEPLTVQGLVRVTVTGEQTPVRVGDSIKVAGWLYRFRGPQNPGEEDFASWLRIQGIHVGLTVESAKLVHVLEDRAAVRVALDRFRSFVRSRLLSAYEELDQEEPRLLDAMVLGHRSAASKAVSEAFRRTGTIHLLSVSGFHVGLLGLVTWWVVRRGLRRGARATAAVTALVLITYFSIADPNSPILRATAMGLLACVAISIGRPLNPTNWLAASAIGILMYSPLDLFDAGFQLSFVQVAGLVIVFPSIGIPLKRGLILQTPEEAATWPAFLRRAASRTVRGWFGASLLCWLVGLPLTMHHFSQLTPWAAVQSALITPLVSLVTIMGFVQTLIGSISTSAAAFSAPCLRGPTHWLVALTDFEASWPRTYIECAPPSAGQVVLMYGGLLLLWRALVRIPRTEPVESRVPSPRRRVTLAAASVAVFSLGCWSGWERRSRSDEVASLHVLSVGNGSAALFNTADGHAALFDCGTILNRDAGDAATRAARVLGIVRLDCFALSHGNFDHFSGLPTLARQMPIERYFMPPHLLDPARRFDAIGRLEPLMPHPTAWEAAAAGRHFSLGPASVEVLWPPESLPDKWDENDRSLVVRIEINGRRMLLPGDASRDALRALLGEHEARRLDLRSDALVAPHHGATVKETAPFLRAVEPECVIVSAGREREGFAQLVRTVVGGHCRVLTTGQSGAVRASVHSDCRLEVSATVRDEPAPGVK
ncbi:MAG: ComEC/Rec2 family competence protein [Planctomycetes bacterium]|nr:ComEC/Rec2 family competence protein [Planctomycetota bacterium]